MLLGLTFAGFAVLLWMSPASPAALGRADALLGRGEVKAAADTYDAIAVDSPYPDARQEALYRGALVYALDLGDTDAARKRLHRLVELGEPAHAADAWEQIGQLCLDESHPRAAGRAFQNAWEIAPKAPRAAERLEWAARARADAGDTATADQLWRDVADSYHDERGTALLSRAEIALGDGNAEAALSLYEEANRTVTEPRLRSVAHLGISACLERLGDLDGALAAIGTGDLPADVLASRRQSLRTRSELSNGNL